MAQPKPQPTEKRAAELASLVIKLRDLERQKSSAVKDFRERADDIKAQIAALSEEIANGQGRLL